MSRRTTALLVAFPVICVVVTVLIALRVVGDNELADAEAACEVADAPEIVRVVDDGDSLTVDAIGQSGLAIEATGCVLDELEAPDSVVAKVMDTAANQGRVTDSWGGYEASWTYRPDDGLNLIIEKD